MRTQQRDTLLAVSATASAFTLIRPPWWYTRPGTSDSAWLCTPTRPRTTMLGCGGGGGAPWRHIRRWIPTGKHSLCQSQRFARRGLTATNDTTITGLEVWRTAVYVGGPRAHLRVLSSPLLREIQGAVLRTWYMALDDVDTRAPLRVPSATPPRTQRGGVQQECR